MYKYYIQSRSLVDIYILMNLVSVLFNKTNAVRHPEIQDGCHFIQKNTSFWSKFGHRQIPAILVHYFSNIANCMFLCVNVCKVF